jgi:hypothetical protein
MAQVAARRAAGASVAQACRDVGLSASTYYRLRRRLEPAVRKPAQVGVEQSNANPPPHRREHATAVAPLFWDGVFKDELSDSYVRRVLGKQKQPLAVWANRKARLSARTYNRVGGLLGGLGMGVISLGCGALASFFRERPNTPAEDGWRVAAGPGLIGLLALTLVSACAFWLTVQAADPAGWGKVTNAPEISRASAGITGH